jgi:hypothetical protein
MSPPTSITTATPFLSITNSLVVFAMNNASLGAAGATYARAAPNVFYAQHFSVIRVDRCPEGVPPPSLHLVFRLIDRNRPPIPF